MIDVSEPTQPGGEGGVALALGIVTNAIVDAVSEFGVKDIEMPATSRQGWLTI